MKDQGKIFDFLEELRVDTDNLPASKAATDLLRKITDFQNKEQNCKEHDRQWFIQELNKIDGVTTHMPDGFDVVKIITKWMWFTYDFVGRYLKICQDEDVILKSGRTKEQVLEIVKLLTVQPSA